MGKCLRNGQSKLVIIPTTAQLSERRSSSTWLSLVAPRCSTSTETTSSSALLSQECTVFACSPSRTLAIRTSSPLWSTEQLSPTQTSVSRQRVRIEPGIDGVHACEHITLPTSFVFLQGYC